MAYFWEEEEDKEAPVAPGEFSDVDFGDLSNVDFGSLDGIDFGGLSDGGYDSDLRFSKANFEERQGRGGQETLQTLQQGLGFGVSDTISNFLTELESEGAAGAAGYRPDYPGYVTDNPVMPWMGEQVGQQAYENAVLYGGGILSSIFKKANLPILAGTSIVTFNSIHDEALNELAELNNTTIADMGGEARWDAFVLAIENTALEILNPFYNKKTKGFMKGGKDKDVLRQVEEYVNKTKKEGFKKVAARTGKSVVRVGGGEAGTELAEQLNTMRVSDPGLGGAFTEEGGKKLLSSAAGGFAGGTVFGGGTIYKEGTDVNRTIREGSKVLEKANEQNLLKAGSEYAKETNMGPSLPGFDVIPESYEVPEQEKGTIKNLGSLAYEKLLGRSTNVFKEALKNAKTGKDVNLIHNQAYSMFGEVESGTGINQEGSSFYTIKHTKLGLYATDFAKIQQKWASMFFPGFGELGGKINPLIDQYVRARMEDKSTSNINITRILNKNKLADLDKDIVKLRGIYNKVHKDLSSVLGESDLKFGFTKNYLTRGLDIQAIEKDKQGFLDDLVNNVGVLPKGMKEADVTTADRYFEAERIYNDILNGKDPAVMSSEQIRQSVNKKGEGRKGFEKHRDLRWDVLDDKYRKTNAFDSMQDYLGRAATRAASAQVFGGNRAEKLSSTVNQMLKRKLIDSDQASQIWDMYDAEHNIYKRPRNEKERAGQKASRALSAVTAISLLGLASISSITEPAWISGRVGVANMLKATPTVAAHVVKGIIRTLYSRQGKQANASFGRDLLNVMGMAINPKINEKVEMLMVGDVTPYMTNWFRAPGGLFLTQYTNFVRIWAGVAGLKMIQDQANKVNRLKGQKLSALKNELKENGMTLDDFKKMVRLGNGKIDIMNDAFLDTRFVKSNGSQVAVRDLLVPWVRKITTDVALEPHVGNRPLWMSNPNLQLIAQLKSFPILFGNTIMLRTMRQINPKICTPSIVGAVGAIGAAATALALAALALELKDAIRGVDEERGAMDWVAGMGLPYAGTVSGQQLVTPAGVTIADNWLRTPFQDEGSTAENILDLLLRTTLGTIAAEQLK